jgi:hypothetical protein
VVNDEVENGGVQPTHVSVREITGHEKLKTVLRNIYRGEDQAKMWGISPDYMQECLKIAAAVRVFQIARPSGVDTLEEIVKIIDGMM